MKNNKIIIYVFVIVLLIIILGAIVKASLFDNATNSSSKYSSINTTQIEQEDSRGDTEYSDYTAEINLSILEVNGTGASVSGTTITIIKEGTYYFTGTLSDGNIVVKAGDNANVVLVFDNANITSRKTAVINGITAKNIYINLKEGSVNTFTDSSSYTEFTEDDEPNATVFSKTDLIISGTGSLIVNANYEDGIVSKDDLIITDATLTVNSADDGIRGKDSVDIKNANITINAKGDGIKSTNDSDSAKGYIIIDGGTYTISSGDDGIHAETSIIINSGTIDIQKSYEGIEAKYIEINGGDISITASDDGINAADGSGSSEFGSMVNNNSSNASVQLVVNGGDIYVNAQGDGLDANGSITMTGGTVKVAGTTNNGNGALDYDRNFNITGGTLVVYGATGMWQNTSNSSTQYAICFGTSGKAGDSIELKDSSGNIIESFETEKAYGAILISNSKLTKGETYTLYVNGAAVSSQELTNIITSNHSNQGGMMGGEMQGNRRR